MNFKLLSLIFTIAILTACGRSSSGGGNNNNDRENETEATFSMHANVGCTSASASKCDDANNDGKIKVTSVIIDDDDHCKTYESKDVMAEANGSAHCDGNSCQGTLTTWSLKKKNDGDNAMDSLGDDDLRICLIFDTDDSGGSHPHTGDVVCSAKVTADDRHRGIDAADSDCENVD